MKYLDSRIRISHPCPFCDLSKMFPEAEFALWSGRTNVVLQVSAEDDTSLREVLRRTKESLKVKEIVRSGNSAMVMMSPRIFRTYSTVSQIASKYRCWTIPPETYHDGWETHRIISPGKEALRKFVSEVRKMGRAEIVSHATKDELTILNDMSIPVHFFEGLTQKQMKYLVTAYESGLFDLPARINLETLAGQANV